MTPSVMESILEKHLQELRGREGIKKMTLDLDDLAKRWLIEKGTHKDFGARPLARAIQKHLLNPLSLCLLEETLGGNDTVLVRVQGGRLSVTRKQ